MPPDRSLHIALADAALAADLTLPSAARGLVLFAHGSGRRSRRDRQVASALQQRGLGTLLFDLLTEREDTSYETRFDIALLSRRLEAVTAWVEVQPDIPRLPIGYFGASTGAAAALNAAGHRPQTVRAVVSRGGRPDLAANLRSVRAATLLIVGSHDVPVLALNEKALRQLHCERKLEIVPGATHLFEEPGTLEQVAALAADWFEEHCVAGAAETA